MHNGLWNNIFLFLSLRDIVKLRLLNKKSKKMVKDTMSLFIKAQKNELQNISETISSYVKDNKDNTFIQKGLDQIMVEYEKIYRKISKFHKAYFCEVKAYSCPPTLVSKTFLAIGYLILDIKQIQSGLKQQPNIIRFLLQDTEKFTKTFSSLKVDDIPEENITIFDEIVVENDLNEEKLIHISIATEQCFSIAMQYRRIIDMKRKMYSDDIEFLRFNNLHKQRDFFSKLISIAERECPKMT